VGNGHTEQRFSRPRRRPAPLFPVLKRSGGNAQERCKCLLRQPRLGASLRRFRQFDLRGARRLAAFHFLDGLQQITLKLFLVFTIQEQELVTDLHFYRKRLDLAQSRDANHRPQDTPRSTRYTKK